jgi:hypothetical protein
MILTHAMLQGVLREVTAGVEGAVAATVDRPVAAVVDTVVAATVVAAADVSFQFGLDWCVFGGGERFHH